MALLAPAVRGALARQTRCLGNHAEYHRSRRTERVLLHQQSQDIWKRELLRTASRERKDARQAAQSARPAVSQPDRVFDVEAETVR
ncbi:hypothetical protein DIPPA_19206 [Diplonema papillatum]|nr:hypothetical protein DIPPA_19206 [Diplonema papillatum]